MKLSSRERNLLIGLGVAVLLFGYYRFIITPQFKSLDAKKQDKIHYEEELIKVQGIIASEKELDKRYEHIGEEIDTYSEKYFAKIDQSKLILLINELLEGTGLFVENTNFNPLRTEGIGDAQVEVMSVSLPYEGTYPSLFSFLEKVRETLPKTIIDNMDIKIKDKDMLSGSILLDFYSLPDLIEDSSIAHLFDSGDVNSDPFYSFETEDEDEDFIIDIEDYGIDLANVKISFDASRVLVEGFDNKVLDFVTSHPSIKGEVSLNKNSRQGTSSLGLHYNYPPIQEGKEVHLVFDSNRAVISRVPQNIGLWVYSYDATKHDIELVLRDKKGERYNINLANSVDWIGWKHLKANIPTDATLYPMEVERIIVGIDSVNDGKGTLLFDSLDAFYTMEMPVITENTFGSYILYDVKIGDTLRSISEYFYNDDASKQDIIKKYNGIKGNDDLKPGKIIIIPDLNKDEDDDDNRGPGQSIVVPN